MSEKLKHTPVIGHTPEPWMFGLRGGAPGYCISAGDFGPDWISIAQVYGDYDADIKAANAHRIVACVNACAGMENPQAEIQSLKTDLEFFKNENDVLRSMVSETPQRYDYIPLFIFISIIGFWAALVTGLIILFT